MQEALAKMKEVGHPGKCSQLWVWTGVSLMSNDSCGLQEEERAKKEEEERLKRLEELEKQRQEQVQQHHLQFDLIQQPTL